MSRVEQVLRDKKAWIFDLDGTLTIPVHDFEHMRRELGMCSGADILQTIASSEAKQKERLIERLDELEAYYAHLAKPALGVVELIEHLAKTECCLGIFTRNTKAMALLSLEAIGVAKYFSQAHIVGRDDAPHKPDPTGLNRLLTQWNVTANDAVMVGDFRFDLEVGKAAGTSTIHVAKDTQRWPELTDYFFPSLKDLAVVL